MKILANMHALTLMLVFLSVVLLSFTCGTFAETAEKIELEKSSDSVKTLTEIWQEDNREVLVRNNRGAKDSSGTGNCWKRKHTKVFDCLKSSHMFIVHLSWWAYDLTRLTLLIGKKKEKSFQSSTKLPKTNRNQENVKSKNVESSSQISQLESSKDEKSPGHHLKHKKTEFSHKKHSNTTTSKPKTKHQSKSFFLIKFYYAFPLQPTIVYFQFYLYNEIDSIFSVIDFIFRRMPIH